MKKTIRLLSVVALVALLGMIVCGCSMLDDMKAVHGILSEDKQTVIYKGETFRKLPEGVPYYFNSSYSNKINVTDEDVPVLLSEGYSYESYYDGLNGILAVSTLEDFSGYDGLIALESTMYYSGSTDHFDFYCTEDNYDEYSQFKAESADRVGFDDYTEYYGTNVLSSETSNEIFDIIKNGNVMSNDAYEEVLDNWKDSIYTLYKCNKSMTLRGTIDGYELYISEDNEVYLANYMTETAQKLSDKASEEILSEYFGY